MEHGKNFLEAWLLPCTRKLYRNPYLRAVRETFYIFIPFLAVLTLMGMVGGLLLDPLGPLMGDAKLGFYLTDGLYGQAYRDSEFFRLLDGMQGIFVVLDLMFSLLFAVALAGKLSKLWRCHPMMGILCTVTAYVFMMPGFRGNEFFSYFMGHSFFLALVTSTLAVRSFSLLSHVTELRMPVPYAMPSKMARHARELPSLLLTLLLMLLLGGLLSMISRSLGSAEGLLQSSLDMDAVQTLPVALAYEFIVRFLWWLGLDGTSLGAVWSMAFYVPAQAANELDGAGYIFTVEFFNAMAVSLLGLAISIWVFSKRQEWRSVSAFSVPWLFFSIGEPFFFALPVVLNPMLLVPYTMASLMNVVVGWVAVGWGIVPIFKYATPLATPLFLDGYLSTGDIMGIVLQLVWLSVDIVIYSPFVIIFNLMNLEDFSAKEGEQA